jgi:hypothetical protein
MTRQCLWQLLLTRHVLPLVAVLRCLLQLLNLGFILYSEFTVTNTYKIYRSINSSVHFTYSYRFRHVSFNTEVKEEWSKIEICFTESLSLQCEFSQGETLKGSFLTLSLSHWYQWLCRPNPAKLTPCGIKKDTHKYLKLNPPTRTALMSRGANSRDLSYPETLTGAPNREGREDKT